MSTTTDGSGEPDGRHSRVLDYLSPSLSASNREKDVKSGELFSQHVPRELNQPLGEARLRGVFLDNDGASSGKRRCDITAENPKSKRKIACSENGNGPQRDEASDLAREAGIDLTTIQGTGPGGRIVRKDFEAHRASSLVSPAAPQNLSGYVEVPHTGMRKAIARRLSESKSTVPHFYLSADCRVDRLVQVRSEVNAAKGVKYSLNDWVVKAVAMALMEVPDANVIWGDTAMRRFDSADISVAVATEGGLFTPVIRGVESMSLGAVNTAIAEAAGRARSGTIKQEEIEGGSFAVTNLGMYGTTEFAAIINPPQWGILAVGAATQRPVVENGSLAVGSVMTVTLSADHRAVDGALAAQWLAAFQRHIENPVGLLL